jgi:hypothetical protein
MSRAASEVERWLVKGSLSEVLRTRGREREMCKGKGTPMGERRRLCR